MKKFKLEIIIEDKKDMLFTLSTLVADVAERLEAQWISDDVGEGVIWDHDTPTGRFEIQNKP